MNHQQQAVKPFAKSSQHADSRHPTDYLKVPVQITKLLADGFANLPEKWLLLFGDRLRAF